MLLPSTLSCDAQVYPSAVKTSTARKMLLSPPRTNCQSPNAPSPNLFAACSALQSLLTSTLPLSTMASRPAARPLDSPIRFTAPLQYMKGSKPLKQKRYPSQGPKNRKKSQQQYTPPPAPSRKRRRDSTPEPEKTSSIEDKENSVPATPKRKRRCHPPPSSLPFRLNQDDFARPHHPHQEQLPQPQPHTPFQLTPQTTFVSTASYRASASASTPKPTSSMTQTPQPQLDPINSTTNLDTKSPSTTHLINLLINKLQLRPPPSLNLPQPHTWTTHHIDNTNEDIMTAHFFQSLLSDEAAAAGLFKRRGRGGLQRGSVRAMEF